MSVDVVRLLAEGMLDFAVYSTVVLGTLALLSRWGRPRPPLLRELAWKAGVVGVLISSAVAAVGSAGAAGSVGRDDAVLERTLLVRRGGEGAVRASEQITLPGSARRSKACRAVAREAVLPSPERALMIREACGGPLDVVPVLLVSLWAVGALVGLLGLGRDALALRRERALARRADPATTRALEGLLARSGIRHPVDVVVVPGLASPAALAPRLIGLPPEAQEDMTPLELEAALAHELAHIRRWDPVWVVVLAASEALFWFQPLMGRARREIREAGELLADDRAVAWTGRPMELARSLARVAEWSVLGRRMPRLAMVRPERGLLSSRVERLLNGSSRAARVHWVALPALVALVLLLQGALPAVHVPRPVRVEVSVTLLSQAGDVRP